LRIQAAPIAQDFLNSSQISLQFDMAEPRLATRMSMLELVANREQPCDKKSANGLRFSWNPLNLIIAQALLSGAPGF
jgi:hypothetical protein